MEILKYGFSIYLLFQLTLLFHIYPCWFNSFTAILWCYLSWFKVMAPSVSGVCFSNLTCYDHIYDRNLKMETVYFPEKLGRQSISLRCHHQKRKFYSLCLPEFWRQDKSQNSNSAMVVNIGTTLINYFIPTNALHCFSVFCTYICFGTTCAIIRTRVIGWMYLMTKLFGIIAYHWILFWATFIPFICSLNFFRVLINIILIYIYVCSCFEIKHSAYTISHVTDTFPSTFTALI
jgi:hypothetical protein